MTANVSFGGTDDGGVGLAVDIEVSIPGVDPGPGAEAGRPGAPVLPVLQGHPRQHRGERQGGLNRPVCRSGLPAPADRVHGGSWPSACSTCSRSGSGRRPPTPSDRCGRLAPSRSGLSQDGLLSEIDRVRVELFGSLGATGRGHGSDKAVVLGLEGETPGARRHRHRAAAVARPRARPSRSVAGPASGPAGAGRPGAAPSVDAAVPSQRHALHRVRRATTPRCGSGRSTRSAAASSSTRRPPEPTGSRPTTPCCPTRSPPAPSCARYAAETGLSISDLMLANETGLAQRGRGPGRAAADLAGHAGMRGERLPQRGRAAGWAKVRRRAPELLPDADRRLRSRPTRCG